ncbi:hypothetical protein ACHHYP_12688 [Achlya hypogyna]|uniref:Uncharacterized protein n=1 Tax=Achlya hypogyna TaxID=1202772 RepID=A0A1V9ZGM4_ACHHY|nr:hypothetical protein ACHHYP_12688 [Achlya hypogyna]
MSSQAGASASLPPLEESLRLISPSRQHDFRTLCALAASQCDDKYSDTQLFATFQDADYSVAGAFELLKKRDDASKKRSRGGEDRDTVFQKRRKNSRLSLPAYSTSRIWTPAIPEDMEYEDDRFGVASSAPPRMAYESFDFRVKTEFGVPSSQKTLREEDFNDDTSLSPSPKRSVNECYNYLMSYCMKLREIKPEADSPTLPAMFEALYASTTPETLSLLEATCAAYNAAEASNPSHFERADEMCLVQDIVMELPHAFEMDRLRKVVRPTVDDIAQHEETMHLLFAKSPPVYEDRVAALNAICSACVERIAAFSDAKEELLCLHAAVADALQTLHARTNAKLSKSSDEVAATERILAERQADEDATAEALQTLVEQERAKALALGITAAAAATRAQRRVFADSANETAVAALARQDESMEAAQAALTLCHGARHIQAFHKNAQMLLTHVETLRRATMQRALDELAAEAASATDGALKKLESALPQLMAELIELDDKLTQRAHHAKSEVACEKLRLANHHRIMGEMAKARQRDYEAIIREYEEVIVACADHLKATAEHQRALWKQMQAVVPPEAFEVIVLACRVHFPALKSPLRDVFADFAQFKPAPSEALAPTAPVLQPSPPAPAVAPVPTSPPLSPAPAQELMVPPPKFEVGETLYAKFESDGRVTYSLGQVIGVFPSRVYLLVFADGDQYNIEENYLFTQDEYEQIRLAALGGDEPRSSCSVM